VSDGDFVHIIDPITHVAADTFNAPFPVASMGFDPIYRKVYLLSADGRLAIINAGTNAVGGEITLPPGNYADSGIAVNINNQLVYIASPRNSFVAVVNGHTDEFMSYLPVAGAGSVTVNPNTNLIYFSTAAGLEVINGNSNQSLGTIAYQSDNGLKNLLVNTCKNNIVASDGEYGLVLFNGKSQTLIESAEAENGIYAMAIDSGLGLLYAVNAARNAVHVYDACSLELLGRITLTPPPGLLTDISVDQRNHIAYITDSVNKLTYVADAGLSQQIGAAVGTGAGDHAITLACYSNCKLCCCNGGNGVEGAVGATASCKHAPQPKPQ